MEIKTTSEQLLFSTTQIVTYKDSNDTRPSGTGTGFIFSYKTTDADIPFLVTNKHVIARAKKGAMTFSQAKDDNVLLGVGYTVTIEDFENVFFGHPDKDIDVAVLPFAPVITGAEQRGFNLFTRHIPYNLIPTEETLKEIDAMEEIIFFGYPNGLWDTKNLLPIVRRGITATPIGIDFEGKKQFLIDASVFPGSSGSPVFLFKRGLYAQRSNILTLGEQLLFLGVVAESHQRWERGAIQMFTTPTVNTPFAVTSQLIDIGVVYKASTIMETIKAALDSKGISHDISII